MPSGPLIRAVAIGAASPAIEPPSTETIVSPASIPARSAGEPWKTRSTRRPRFDLGDAEPDPGEAPLIASLKRSRSSGEKYSEKRSSVAAAAARGPCPAARRRSARRRRPRGSSCPRSASIASARQAGRRRRRRRRAAAAAASPGARRARGRRRARASRADRQAATSALRSRGASDLEEAAQGDAGADRRDQHRGGEEDRDQQPGRRACCCSAPRGTRRCPQAGRRS